MARIWLVCLVLLGLSGTASAHEWYDPECCTGKDCHPAVSVEMQENGDYIVKSDDGETIVVPPHFAGKHPSQDQKFHICYQMVSRRGGKIVPAPICFYIPGTT